MAMEVKVDAGSETNCVPLSHSLQDIQDILPNYGFLEVPCI